MVVQVVVDVGGVLEAEQVEACRQPSSSSSGCPRRKMQEIDQATGPAIPCHPCNPLRDIIL